MNESTLRIPYGILSGVATASSYPDGQPRDIILREKNVVVTHVGDLIPWYDADSPRRKYKSSLSFHPNGLIKSVSLQEQQEIQTPIGELPAELVTFYDTGELKRCFVLDGQISGFWSIADERKLNVPLRFAFPFATFQSMISGICFFQSGSIRSLTLYPGEEISVKVSALGDFPVRNGFSLYETGELRSLEPAFPVAVETPIGTLHAYDAQAVGISADSGSLLLDERGRLSSLTSTTDRILANVPGYPLCTFAPLPMPDPIDPRQTIPKPLKIRFCYEESTVTIGDAAPLPMNREWFTVIAGEDISGCSPTDCASCKRCPGKAE